MWIEIRELYGEEENKESLPSRECGLKYTSLFLCSSFKRSLPSRECGLKFLAYYGVQADNIVTPFAGVWIEMQMKQTQSH